MLARGRGIPNGSFWCSVDVCMYVCMYMRAFMFHVCGYVCVCVYVCMYVYIYIYIYIYIYRYVCMNLQNEQNIVVIMVIFRMNNMM